MRSDGRNSTANQESTSLQTWMVFGILICGVVGAVVSIGSSANGKWSYVTMSFLDYDV